MAARQTQRESHFAAMNLSDDALAIVHAGFLARATLDRILARVTAETTETIARSSLGRYRTWWRSEHRAAQDAQAYGREIAASLKQYPAKEQQRIIEQKLSQLMLLKLKEVEGDKPLDVAYLALAERKIRMKERQIELEARKVAALETKVKRMEEAAERARKTIDRAAKKKVLSPEDLTTIREQLYGLA